MVAVGGLYQTVIAHLAAFVKAPCIKFRYHLTGLDALVQTAGLLGAGILSVIGGERGEQILRLVACQPQIQNGLSLLFTGSPLFIGVGGLAILAGGAALGLEQNVAHVYGLALFLGDLILRQLFLVLGEVGIDHVIGDLDGVVQVIVVAESGHIGAQISTVAVLRDTGADVVSQHGINGFVAAFGL